MTEEQSGETTSTIKVEETGERTDGETKGEVVDSPTPIVFTRVKTDNEKIEEAEDRIAVDKFDTEAWTVC